MENHSEKASRLFHQGYNCAQAVFATFHDEVSLDLETALKLSSSFGGGMGRLWEICGAVSSMFMVAGMLYGYSDPDDHQAKTNHYELIQRLASKFMVANRSIICRELLELQESPSPFEPEKRSDAYYKGRPCSGLVEFAAKLTSELLEKRGIVIQTEKDFPEPTHEAS